jgi:hypothetical protein
LKKKSERFGVFGAAKPNVRKDVNDDDLWYMFVAFILR